MPFQTFHRCAPFQSFKSFKERKRGTSKTHAKFRRQVPQCNIQTTEKKFLFFRLTRQPAEVRFCAFAGYLEQTLLAFVADDERMDPPGGRVWRAAIFSITLLLSGWFVRTTSTRAFSTMSEKRCAELL
jgi:hypothetical protein